MNVIAQIQSGQIDKESLDNIAAHFRSRKDGEYRIEIKKYYKNRTIPQNRLLWDIYRQVSEQTGYETEEVHAMMGQKFLLNRDAKTPYVVSTTKLSTLEFNEFIAKIVRFFTVEAGLIIYLPEDYNESTQRRS